MDSFTKHLVEPVAPAAAAAVDLWIGEERRVLSVSRPMRFDQLSVVSTVASSAPIEVANGGVRSLVKGALSRFALPLKIDGPFVDTRHCEPNNIAHLLLDIIPLCLLIRRALETDPVFIFGSLGRPFRELLSVFQIDPICSNRRASGRRVEAFASRELAQYRAIIPECPFIELLGSSYEGLLDDVPKTGSDKLFISRKGPRALINDHEVRKSLEAVGFRTAYFEEMSIREQISAVLSAKDVVCIHGAAMGYLALKRSFTQIVELLPPNVYHNLFPIAVGRNAKRYVQLSPKFDDDVQFSGWADILRHKQTPFAVDVGQLRSAMQL
jgi:capsular polysaccharide biosynthesis protein